MELVLLTTHRPPTMARSNSSSDVLLWGQDGARRKEASAASSGLPTPGFYSTTSSNKMPVHQGMDIKNILCGLHPREQDHGIKPDVFCVCILNFPFSSFIAFSLLSFSIEQKICLRNNMCSIHGFLLLERVQHALFDYLWMIPSVWESQTFSSKPMMNRKIKKAKDVGQSDCSVGAQILDGH